jgi:hypothetical protein
MAASLWLLNIGCLLRVCSEAVAYSSCGFAWKILPISPSLELAGTLAFASNLAHMFTEPLPVWFGPEDLKGSMTLYWTVTSYPRTRSILIRSGLGTLAHAHDVPRSLTLEEAAEADGANTGRVLAALREFVRQRQPRREGRASALTA